jgi:hypothetical protein
VSIPGPPGVLWTVSLLLWALEVAVVGEAVRGVAARWVPAWRSTEPIERGLLDLYLGGGLFYLLAAVPAGLFGAPLVNGLPIAAAAFLLVRVWRARRSGRPTASDATLRALARPAALLTIASVLGLYLVEMAVALPIGSGNTFDSSLLTTYTALLLRHGSIPLSFGPYAAPMILYPQGTTVWLGSAQLAFGLPPPRTALLVTPLFLALAPAGGFVLGRRMFGTETAGAAVAISLAWLGPATRGVVGGSNDFAFAFPLVLLLAAQSTLWFRPATPTLGDSVGFGVLLGYSAAMNPVGAQWMMPGLVIVGLLTRPMFGGSARRWLGRWATTLGAALVGIAPTLYVLLRGWSSPGFVPGSVAPPSPMRTGISPAQFLGDLDPFLFRPQDVALSPVPALRLELAVLIVIGLAVLLLPRPGSAVARYVGPFRRWAFATAVAIVAWLAILTASWSGVPGAAALTALSSGAELSLWIFTVYGLVAAVPLVLVFERFAAGERSVPGPARPSSVGIRRGIRGSLPPAPAGRRLLPYVLAVAIVAPGLVLTPVSFAPTLTDLYDDFGRASPADFALLEYAGAHLPAGSRVLISPGGFAAFLPGYAADLVLLYPLVPGFPWENASYRLVVAQLWNATLDAGGRSALASLDVGFVAVTMNNTVLWPAFSPAPLLGDPGAFDDVWNEGDAYLFAVNQSAL